MVEFFLQCCERFLAMDAEMIRCLRESGFELIDDGWNLTLPQLHSFLVSQVSEREVLPYKAFRQSLFESGANTRLVEKGGIIVIATNMEKVDLSTYRLQHLVVRPE